MNSRSLLTILIAFGIATSSSRGAVVKEGVDIDAVNRAMAEAGYSETGLAMETRVLESTKSIILSQVSCGNGNEIIIDGLRQFYDVGGSRSLGSVVRLSICVDDR